MYCKRKCYILTFRKHSTPFPPPSTLLHAYCTFPPTVRTAPPLYPSSICSYFLLRYKRHKVIRPAVEVQKKPLYVLPRYVVVVVGCNAGQGKHLYPGLLLYYPVGDLSSLYCAFPLDKALDVKYEHIRKYIT